MDRGAFAYGRGKSLHFKSTRIGVRVDWLLYSCNTSSTSRRGKLNSLHASTPAATHDARTLTLSLVHISSFQHISFVDVSVLLHTCLPPLQPITPLVARAQS